MEHRRYLTPAEGGAQPPQYVRGRDREWVVVAYLKGRNKPLGVFRAQSGDAAIGLAKQRHPGLKATFEVRLAHARPSRKRQR